MLLETPGSALLAQQETLPKATLDRLFVVCGALLTGLAAGQVVASGPYAVSVFATSVFVGYGDRAAPDGSVGKSSTIVEYKPKGDIVSIYTVLGHTMDFE